MITSKSFSDELFLSISHSLMFFRSTGGEKSPHHCHGENHHRLRVEYQLPGEAGLGQHSRYWHRDDCSQKNCWNNIYTNFCNWTLFLDYNNYVIGFFITSLYKHPKSFSFDRWKPVGYQLLIDWSQAGLRHPHKELCITYGDPSTLKLVIPKL